MTFIDTPAAAKAVFIYDLFGQTLVNNIWFGGSSNYTEANLDSLADALASWWDAELQQYQTDDITLDTIKTYDMSDIDGPVYELTVNGVGEDIGAALPGQNAMVVTFKTANRGRSGRGRVYLPPFNEDQCVGNIWDSTLRGNIETVFGNLNSYVSSINSSEHVVVSFQKNGVTLSTGNKQTVTDYQARAGVKAIRARS